MEDRKLNGGKKISKLESETAVGNDADNDGEIKEKSKEKRNDKLNRNQNKCIKKEKEEINDDALRQRAMKKKGQLFLPKPFSGGSRGTLLRNLLLHEVEAEENILLQCLRLIVTNNYLQPTKL